MALRARLCLFGDRPNKNDRKFVFRTWRNNLSLLLHPLPSMQTPSVREQYFVTLKVVSKSKKNLRIIYSTSLLTHLTEPRSAEVTE